MKIKVPAQTKMKLTESAFERDVMGNAQMGTADDLSDNLIGIAEHSDGTNAIYQMLPIHESNPKLLTSMRN